MVLEGCFYVFRAFQIFLKGFLNVFFLHVFFLSVFKRGLKGSFMGWFFIVCLRGFHKFLSFF